MNFIEKKARAMVDLRISRGRIGDAKKLLQVVRDDLYDVDDESDKLTYLTIVLEANEQAYHEHLKVCKNIESCGTNQDHEMVTYFLQQELKRIGVEINDNTFTREEKANLTDYLDKILSDLKDLKDGQQIIYDDLKEEIEELKRWFLLGKKNWRQMAVGKFGEMVAGGIVSAGIAEPILDTLKTEVPKLIGG